MTAVSEAYRTRMRKYAEMGHLEVWYSRLNEEDVLASLSAGAGRFARKLLDKARSRSNLQVLGKMTDRVDSEQRIHESRPLIVRETVTTTGRPIAQALTLLFRSCLASVPEDRRPLLERYRVADVARKVVGVGSVGSRSW